MKKKLNGSATSRAVNEGFKYFCKKRGLPAPKK